MECYEAMGQGVHRCFLFFKNHTCRNSHKMFDPVPVPAACPSVSTSNHSYSQRESKAVGFLSVELKMTRWFGGSQTFNIKYHLVPRPNFQEPPHIVLDPPIGLPRVLENLKNKEPSFQSWNTHGQMRKNIKCP